MPRPEFESDEPSSSRKKEPKPILTANMYLKIKRKLQAKALRRRYAYSNQILAGNGVWYPEDLPIELYNFYDLNCRNQRR